MQFILEERHIVDDMFRYGFAIDHLDIFGKYCILDTSASEQKYSFVSSSKEAAYLLRIQGHESFHHMRSQYLINVSKGFQSETQKYIYK